MKHDAVLRLYRAAKRPPLPLGDECQRIFGAGLLLLTLAVSVQAATTINATNRFAYGANNGWVDARGDGTNGAVIGEYVCAGFLYGANVGWISMGGGVPTNGIQYQNLAATDFGVNHDGVGNLRGFAYGANIGWIAFESNGAPRVNLLTGKLNGFAYSANCGWISLSNAFAFVQTDVIAAGVDLDGDGMADAWERLHLPGGTNALPGTDGDGDGHSNVQEYWADTDPVVTGDVLEITVLDGVTTGAPSSVTWDSELTRVYEVQKGTNLIFPVWTDSGLGTVAPDGAFTTRAFADTNAPAGFYRVRAKRPLAP